MSRVVFSWATIQRGFFLLEQFVYQMASNSIVEQQSCKLWSGCKKGYPFRSFEWNNRKRFQRFHSSAFCSFATLIVEESFVSWFWIERQNKESSRWTCDVRTRTAACSMSIWFDALFSLISYTFCRLCVGISIEKNSSSNSKIIAMLLMHHRPFD